MGRHVLVAVDGSAESEAALEYALEDLAPARVTLLHVVNPTGHVGGSDEDYFDIAAYHTHAEQCRERGEQLLATCRETAAAHDVAVETRLETGRPAREILDAADETDVDHIVVGSRGRSGLGRVLFGSVAKTVTRRASVPVTVVR